MKTFSTCFVLLLSLYLSHQVVAKLDCYNKTAADCKQEFGLEFKRRQLDSTIKLARNFTIDLIDWANHELPLIFNTTVKTDLNVFITDLESVKQKLEEASSDPTIKSNIFNGIKFEKSHLLYLAYDEEFQKFQEELMRAKMEGFFQVWRDIYDELISSRPADVKIYPEYKELDAMFRAAQATLDLDSRRAKMQTIFHKMGEFF